MTSFKILAIGDNSTCVFMNLMQKKTTTTKTVKSTELLLLFKTVVGKKR